MDPVIALLCLLVIYLLYRLNNRKAVVVEQTVMSGRIFPFEKREHIFSAVELRLFNLVRSTVGDKYHLSAKVNMEAVIDVKRNISASARHGYMDKLTSQFADIVLCRAQDMKIICVILFDHKGEMTPAEKEHAEYVDKAFRAASIALIRFKMTATYNEKAIAAALKKGISDAAKSEEEAAEQQNSGNHV